MPTLKLEMRFELSGPFFQDFLFIGVVWLFLDSFVFIFIQNGSTALMKAVRSNHAEIVDLLLKAAKQRNVDLFKMFLNVCQRHYK